MYSYSIIQWLFFFHLYCFLGWCIESVYVSVKNRKLTNRGFMRGPFLPLYGSGAIMMLVVSMPFQDNIFMVYVAGCVGATVLEYVTGVTMEALFKVRYWDYSDQKFNFQGHVCLGTTLSWGFLTILMTEVIHVPIERFVLSISEPVLNVATCVLTVLLCADFVLSFKAAIDLRNVLIKMEKAKEELVFIWKRLDDIISMTNQEVENYRATLAGSVNSAKEELAEGMAMRIEDVKTSIENKLDVIKNIIVEKPSEYLESVKEEILELKTKYTANLSDRNRMSGLKDFFQRDMLRSNPGMTSVKFKEALEELKERASRKKGE